MVELFHNLVGILGPTALFLVALVTVTHMYQKYKGTNKGILIVSKFSLVCTIVSLICVILTYYKPYLYGDYCGCQLLWKTSLVCFVTAIFAVKFMYIIRVYIYFKQSSTDGTNIGEVPYSVYILIGSTIMCYSASVTTQFFLISGECYDDMQKYGCINRFHNGDIYVALSMLGIDIILFYWYSKTWNNKINMILKHSPKSVQIQNQKLLSSFRKQLMLTTLALCVTIIDAILHLIFQKYFVINVFIIDNLTVSFANTLGFAKLRTFLFQKIVECLRCFIRSKKVRSGDNRTNPSNNIDRTRTMDIESNNPAPTNSITKLENTSDARPSSIELKSTQFLRISASLSHKGQAIAIQTPITPMTPPLTPTQMSDNDNDEDTNYIGDVISDTMNISNT